MPAKRLDGKTLSASIRERIKGHVDELRRVSGVTPGLAVILVGNNPASRVYVKNKRTACQEAGIDALLHELSDDTSESAVLTLVDRLNEDSRIHGILVQLPLPAHLNEATILAAVDPLKDVDGFHPVNAGLLALGRPRFVPCTPLGIRSLLHNAGVVTAGSHAVVLGRSNVVGKPLALLLLQKGKAGDATVTVAHTATREPARLTREADILIVAAGRPRLVTGDWVKPGATVVDVGIHRLDDGSLCGDVDAATVAPIAGLLSPVPGGVGPMTIAMLLTNTLASARVATGMGNFDTSFADLG